MLQRRTLGTVADSRAISISEICRRLNVTIMSTNAWRKGSMTRRPLPTLYGYSGKSVRIGIAEAELLAWLHQYRPDLIIAWNSTRT